MSTSSVIRRFMAPLVCAMLVTACQTLGPAGLVPSTVTTELTPDAANTIASDMVSRFSEQVGPGNTTISLTPDSSAFGQALESELRSRGYAVVTDQKTEDTSIIALAYVIDDYDGSVFVRISTLSFDLTRMYKVGAEGTTPVSPLSVRQHGSESAV